MPVPNARLVASLRNVSLAGGRILHGQHAQGRLANSRSFSLIRRLDGLVVELDVRHVAARFTGEMQGRPPEPDAPSRRRLEFPSSSDDEKRSRSATVSQLFCPMFLPNAARRTWA
jgi:hypothetical protein